MSEFREGTPKKKLLMLCHHYPPTNNGGVERSIKFVEYLPEYGWEARVITTSLHGRESGRPEPVTHVPEPLSIYWWIFNRERRKAKRKSRMISVSTETTPERGVGRSLADLAYKWLAVPDIHLGWAILAFWPALSALFKAEAQAIYTTSPPVSSHLLGLVLKKLTRKPWVADLRDPWTFEPSNRYLRQSEVRLTLEKRLERRCFAHADAIILNTPEAVRRYKDLYPEYADKMRSITNGFDSEEIERAAAALGQPAPWQEVGKDTFVISHTGVFYRYVSGSDPTPHALLEALKRLLVERSISPENCRVVLAGTLNSKTVSRISELGLEDLVDTPGMISHFDATRLMLRSDLLLLSDSEEDGATYVRGKLYDYLGSGNMILGMVPWGASRRLLERSGRGFLVSPEDAEDIKRAVLEAMEKSHEPTPASDFELMAYERRRLTGLLADTLDEILVPGDAKKR